MTVSTTTVGGGATTKVHDETLTVAAQNVTITYAFSSSKFYRIIVRTTYSATGTMYLFFNGNTTINNYWCQETRANNTTESYGRVNYPYMGSANNGKYEILDISLYQTPDNVVNALVNDTTGTSGSGICMARQLIQSAAAVNPLTSITLNCATAGAFGIGTRIQVWELE